MDLLFSRYADPFLFLDQLISCGRFAEGLYEIAKLANDDELQKMYLTYRDGFMDQEGCYHFYLSKTFSEWKRMLFSSEDSKTEITEEADVEATVKFAEDILQNFVPPGKGVGYECES